MHKVSKVLLRITLCATALSTTYFGIQYMNTVLNSKRCLMQLVNDLEKIDPRIYLRYGPIVEEMDMKS